MKSCVWVQFPNTRPEDPWAIPPPLPPPAPNEIEIKLECTIRLSIAEGPIVSQSGALLDVLASMLKDHKAGSGLLWASWEEPAWVNDWPK